MTKRVSNTSNKRNGKLHARQTVRLGWRKKRVLAIRAALKQQAWLNAQTEVQSG
jgi:hypothetical protein